jgi:cysteine desulfurase
MARAYELAVAERAETTRRVRRLRDRLKAAVLAVEGTELTGHPRDRLPGHLSIIARDIDGTAVALALDLEGVAASVGSACTTGSTEVSHVLTAMGYPEEEARGALRLSLGRTTVDADVDRAAEIVPRTLSGLRVGAAAVAADPLNQGVAGYLPGIGA